MLIWVIPGFGGVAAQLGVPPAKWTMHQSHNEGSSIILARPQALSLNDGFA